MDLKTISATLALMGSSGLIAACDKKPPENQRKDAAEIPVDGAQPAAGAADNPAQGENRGEGKCGEGKCGEGSCGANSKGESKDGAAVPAAATPDGDPPDDSPDDPGAKDDDRS